MSNKEYPSDGDEVEIKYKIYTFDNNIIDSTENKPNFTLNLNKSMILGALYDTIISMKKNETKIINFDIESEPNIFDLFKIAKTEDISKITKEQKEVKIEVTLVDFNPKIKSIYELTNAQKYEKAKTCKNNFIGFYKLKKYNDSLTQLDDGINYMDKISKECMNEEMEKFKTSLLLNKCNVFNCIKKYSDTKIIAKKIIENDNKNVKAIYYLTIALLYLDENEECEKNYKLLYELYNDKNDSGLINLRKMIDNRKNEKEDFERKKFKAFLKSKKD